MPARDRPVEHGDLAATFVSGSVTGLGALLESGIRSLGSLDHTDLVPKIPLEEQPPVPIDMLFYRGRAALRRAREIGDDLRAISGPVPSETLGELFDLLDLAVTE